MFTSESKWRGVWEWSCGSWSIDNGGGSMSGKELELPSRIYLCMNAQAHHSGGGVGMHSVCGEWTNVCQSANTTQNLIDDSSHDDDSYKLIRLHNNQVNDFDWTARLKYSGIQRATLCVLCDEQSKVYPTKTARELNMRLGRDIGKSEHLIKLAMYT